MSKTTFKGSLLATTIIAGMVIASPALAQVTAPPADAPPPTTPPTDTQGNGAPATPTADYPPAGTQSNESSQPAEPTSAKEIVVTGTLIRNPNLVASAPVTVVGQDELQLRQTNTAEEVLRTIPAAVPSIGNTVNNGNGGSSFVDLRGLGPNRNLVLLDGVRLTPVTLSGLVDLNDIPLALIDRVDVLTGGASSTYGADAIGGVVNFITRSDFSGMELSVSDQITQRGDGNYLRGDLTLGANFDDGRGNAVVSIGYQEADPIYQGFDRPGSQVAFEAYDINCIPCQGSPTATPSVLEGLSSGASLQLSPDNSAFIPLYAPFNFNPYNIFQVPFKRYNLYSAGHYDISDHITAYGRGLYADNTVATIVAPSGLFNSTVTVPLSNPFLNDSLRAQLCAEADSNPSVAGRQPLTAAQCAAGATATDPDDPNFQTVSFGLRRRTPEVGPRLNSYNTKVFDFRAGMRGDITDHIGWDVWGAHGESQKVQTIQGYVLRSKVRQALLATNPDTCLDTTNECVPLNIFGQPGTITPAMAGFISDESTTRVNTRLSQGRATINGDTPLTLWAAQPISFAVGAEYRKYTASQRADQLAKTPGELGGAGGAAPDIDGSLDVYEGFGEIVAPLISDRPFFQELQVEAGIRRSHYTIDAPGQPKFNTTTWKVAGSWAPVDDIKFRGNYQHAVRAPNISELFSPVSTGLTNLATDPCQGAAPLNNPNLAAVCIAQGADPSFLGGIAAPAAGQVNVTGGGNPFLSPETANTWTVGAVLRPRFIPGFNATLDYYHIKITGAVSFPTPGDLITACFGADPTNPPPGAAANPACTIIRRDPNTGGLDGDPADTPGLFAPLSNLGKIETDGVDLTMNYRRTLGTVMGSPAKLNLSFGGNYTHKGTFQATPTSLNRSCIGFYSVNCNPQPKFSFNQRTTLTLGRVDFSLLWRYIHKMKFEPAQLEADAAAADASNRDAAGNLLPAADQGCPDFNGADPNGCMVDPVFRNIKSHHYFDFSTRFNVNEHFDLTLTIQNLFDKDPPNVSNDIGSTTFNSGNTYPATYDPLGRRFAAGARIKF